MRRREFGLLGCLLVGLPLAARAQQSAKTARIDASTVSARSPFTAESNTARSPAGGDDGES